MEQEGILGKFNRAQRAIQNYNESYPQNVFYILLAGIMYPKEVMILSSVFAAARVKSALGYTQSAKGRMPGFMLSNLSIGIIEALVVISGFRAI